MSRGVMYSAYGERAIKECLKSIETLKHSNSSLPFCVMTDVHRAFNGVGARRVISVKSDPFGRLAKLQSNCFSSFESTLYIDADTRIWGSLELPFRVLEDGFDFCVTLSVNQGDGKWLWHISEDERVSAFNSIGALSAAMQGGVWGFRKNDRTAAFFETWRELFRKEESEHDQAAMQAALRNHPMKAYLLGRDFNGGAVIHHHFGQARRTDV
jgi:hypothetical protein